MSPKVLTAGPVRSAAEVNEEIRALWLRAGGSLSEGEAADYRRLVVEWATAVRCETTHVQAA
jgi:hypothetical protein